MIKKLLLQVALAACFMFSINTFAADFSTNPTAGIVVVETDFGLKDGAVSEVKGVMYNVDKNLLISDLTHEIPAFNIWEAAYRLYQTANYWPKGTVFVSVIDPGVGTKRKSIVAKSNNGQFFVTPDNGTLTMIANNVGLKEVRQIDETKNRLRGSSESYTFHGRDVYGYTAARLASGKITFEEVGPKLDTPIVKIKYQKPYVHNKTLMGTVVVLDPQYGNLWTNIDSKLAKQYGISTGGNYRVRIFDQNKKVFEKILPYQHTFGQVNKGSSLIYTNSLLNLAIGVNQDNFSTKYHVKSGPNWKIEIEKA